MVLDDFEGGYDNFYCDETDELAEEILDLVLVENNPSIKELKAIVEGYKFKDIKKRIKSFWRRAKFEWIVVGNFNK